MFNFLDQVRRRGGAAINVTIGGPAVVPRLDNPRLTAEARTDTGKVRRINEDSILSRLDLSLWAVADGVGGYHAGDVASATLVEKLQELDPALDIEDRTAVLRRLIEHHHEYLCDLATERGGQTIASTIVALTIKNWRYSLLWAGDSRAYLWRAGRLIRLSRDHSVVQELIDRGSLRQEQAEGHPRANVITSAVGSGEQLRLDESEGDVQPGDIFLLCSDGLTRMVPEDAIRGVLLEKYPSLIADELIENALSAGGRDNVSVITVCCSDTP